METQKPEVRGYNRNLVTTQYISMWDMSSNQLRLGGSNDGLSVGIWIPQISSDGGKKYPMEHRHTVVLKPNLVCALGAQLTGDILPAFEAGRDAKVKIPLNMARTSFIEVSLDSNIFTLSIIRDFNETTNEPRTRLTFRFDTIIINTPNPTTVQADFYLFVKVVQSYIDNVGGMVAGHGYRYTEDYSKRQMQSIINAIATKLEIELPNAAYRDNPKPQQQPQGETYFPDNAPPVTVVGKVDDMLA